MLYKLTDANGRTRGGTQWGPGVRHRPDAAHAGRGGLCGPGWIHAYPDPLVAVIRDPCDAHLGPSARLWEAEGEVGQTDHGLKIGCLELTTVREIPLPVLTTEQRVRCAIACAAAVYQEPSWQAWARAWGTGEERSELAAKQARDDRMGMLLTAVFRREPLNIGA